MARGRKSQLSLPDGAPKVAAYKHSSEKRTNIPSAKIAGEGDILKVKRVQYAYNPHLPPALRFDPTGQADRTLASLHGTLDKLPLKAAERVKSTRLSPVRWLPTNPGWSGPASARSTSEASSMSTCGAAHPRADLGAGLCADGFPRGRSTRPLSRPGVALQGGGALLPTRCGLGKPSDPWGFAPGDVLACPPRELRRKSPDDLPRPALRDQVRQQRPARSRPPGREP